MTPPGKHRTVAGSGRTGAGHGSGRTGAGRTDPDGSTTGRTAAEAAPRPARRRGRPSAAGRVEGEPGTQERILASARTEFAGRGYDRTSVRAIARGAEVDPALVHHYFGTKEQVFGAVLENSFAPVLEGLETLPPARPEALGEQLTRLFFSIWENPATRDPLLAVIRSALTNEAAAAVFRDLVALRVMRRVTREAEPPAGDLRAELAAAQLVGAALLRYVTRVEPLASVPVEQLIARLAPVIQHHLAGGGPAVRG